MKIAKLKTEVAKLIEEYAKEHEILIDSVQVGAWSKTHHYSSGLADVKVAEDDLELTFREV